MSGARERLTVHFTGHVQGVGFRWRACRAVEGLEVEGYVKNLPDGRVEMVIEGNPASTAAAVERVRSTMAGLIRHITSVTSDPTGEFRGFGVYR